LKEYKIHLRRLQKTRLKTFYGFDDCNGYVFPLLYACQESGIKTVGHQHGAYVKRHAGYVMDGIEKSSYRWFDTLVVWGEYWKEQLLRISNVYQSEMIVTGSNKISWRYDLKDGSRRGRKSILIPYEFLTNTFKVGQYMAAFIDLGYSVFFKPRSDERLEDQLEAYCLSQEHLSKVTIVTKLDGEFMKGIDIVAGTMTTLIFELLPFNKIVWILETEYRHLEDLVESGLAHKVRYQDLGALDDHYFVPTKVDDEYLFCREPLRETLERRVLHN